VSYRIGIINVTGYAGMEAARLLWKHPEARIVAATGRSLAGQRLGDAFPHLALYGDFRITEEILESVDVVFSSLPTAASAEACAPFVRAGVKSSISLLIQAARPGAFEQWRAGAGPPGARLLAEAVYGLPELIRERIAPARLVRTGLLPGRTHPRAGAGRGWGM